MKDNYLTLFNIRVCQSRRSSISIARTSGIISGYFKRLVVETRLFGCTAWSAVVVTTLTKNGLILWKKKSTILFVGYNKKDSGKLKDMHILSPCQILL